VAIPAMQGPERVKLLISQLKGEPAPEKLLGSDILVLQIPAKAPDSLWASLPDGKQLRKLLAPGLAEAGTVRRSQICMGGKTSQVLLAVCPEQASRYNRLEQARKLTAKILEERPASATVMAAGLGESAAMDIAEATASALYAAVARMPTRKSKPEPAPALKRLRFAGLPGRLDTRRIEAEAHGNHLARWLTALPPNDLNPGGYRRQLEKLAKQNDWGFRFFGEKELAKHGAGAFLAVSQASAERDAGIAHLRYRPAKNTAPPSLALVGKGICFDTGGSQLKPFKSMLNMHEDMGGSAVAVGLLQALTDLKYPEPVDCWLAIAENRIGSRGYIPQDILTAANGTTIQTIHTDAEGRLVLADTLHLASKTRPSAIIDFATLTGACVAALTERYSGVFTNREHLNSLLIEAGRDSGERVWPFPMDEDFDQLLESEVADLLQCSTSNDGDHILGARFLSRFVGKKIAWIHVDLSAVNHKGGLGHVPTSITGFGVRFVLNLLLEQRLMNKLDKL
jgi:leucyl aminopeptidase